ncbi:MAG TPA: hypothetical protein VII23_05335 [Terriglobales bacterium]
MEEIQGMQIVADRIPVLLKTISLRFKEQLLKSTVELPDCLLFINTLIPESGAFPLAKRGPRGELAAIRGDFGILSLT